MFTSKAKKYFEVKHNKAIKASMQSKVNQTKAEQETKATKQSKANNDTINEKPKVCCPQYCQFLLIRYTPLIYSYFILLRRVPLTTYRVGLIFSLVLQGIYYNFVEAPTGYAFILWMVLVMGISSHSE